MCLLASIVNIEYSILNIGEFLQLLIESLHLDHFISASKNSRLLALKTVPHIYQLKFISFS